MIETSHPGRSLSETMEWTKQEDDSRGKSSSLDELGTSGTHIAIVFRIRSCSAEPDISATAGSISACGASKCVTMFVGTDASSIGAPIDNGVAGHVVSTLPVAGSAGPDDRCEKAHAAKGVKGLSENTIEETHISVKV